MAERTVHAIEPPMRLSWAERLLFGSGSVGTAAFVVAPQLLMMFYLTELLAVPAAWAGLALLLPKLWEVVADPAVGLISDRTDSRFGRRRPFLLAGALIFPLAFWGLFSVPDLPGWEARLAFAACAFLVCTTAYAVFAVPYITLPGELSADRDERTVIVSVRVAFMAIGILMAGAAAPLLVEQGGGGRDAYGRMGLIIGLIAGATMLAAFAGSRRARIDPPSAEPVRITALITGLVQARGFVKLQAGYGLQMAGAGANAAMLAYVAKYLLDAGEALVGFVFLAFTLASLAATPVFARMGVALGKRPALAVATLLYAAALAALLKVPVLGPEGFMALALPLGTANAGTQILAFSLLPDVVEAESARAGRDMSGFLTGIWIAAEKLGLALGASLAGLVIGLAGFVEGGAGDQPASALSALVFVFSLGPALLLLASLPLLARPSRSLGV